MKLKVLAGEYLWTKEGNHLVCDKGFAVVAKEDTEIEVDDDKHEKAFDIVKSERKAKGKDPATGLDLPSPDVATAYEQQIEQEIQAELDQEEAQPKKSRRKKKAAVQELPAEEEPKAEEPAEQEADPQPAEQQEPAPAKELVTEDAAQSEQPVEELIQEDAEQLPPKEEMN